MAVKIRLETKGLQRLFDEVHAKYGNGVEVQAGFLEGGITDDSSPVQTDITEVATYAAQNEYGTGKIPSRPFMRTAFNVRNKFWQKNVETLLKAGLSSAEAFEKAGELMRDDIRGSIDGVFQSWTPNSPITIRNKTRKSINADGSVRDANYAPRPLIDTGSMHKSVGYKLINSGEEA